MRLIAILLLLPSVAGAQVEGVSLAYKREGLATQPGAISLRVGPNVVGFSRDEAGYCRVVAFDGTYLPAPKIMGERAVAFCGEHIYMVDQGAIHAFDKAGKETQTLTGDRLNEASFVATLDGTTLFAANRFAPAGITVYARDADTGELKKTQVFQTDEEGLEAAKIVMKAKKKPIVIDPAAVRVPKFDGLAGMCTDGKRLLVACQDSHSVVLFAKTAKGWEHLQSLPQENKALRMPLRMKQNGLLMCEAITQAAGEVFVSGHKRLSRLRLKGETLESVGFLVDDSDPVASEYGPAFLLPFLEGIHSLALSKNGKYLFVGTSEAEGILVCKVGVGLEVLGTLKDSPSAKHQQVATSPDGKKLFCTTTTAHLLIYDLDDRFTK